MDKDKCEIAQTIENCEDCKFCEGAEEKNKRKVLPWTSEDQFELMEETNDFNRGSV